MTLTTLEQFIHDYLVESGWDESQFGVVSVDFPTGGSCNLTYIIADVIRAYNKSLVESLGHPTNDNEYELDVDEHKRWWITHKHVQSGEPFLQFLNSEPINK